MIRSGHIITDFTPVVINVTKNFSFFTKTEATAGSGWICTCWIRLFMFLMTVQKSKKSRGVEFVELMDGLWT